jgi:hypothetical protein
MERGKESVVLHTNEVMPMETAISQTSDKKAADIGSPLFDMSLSFNMDLRPVSTIRLVSLNSATVVLQRIHCTCNVIGMAYVEIIDCF